MTGTTPLDRARAPRANVWVVANAGSGKTHALAERVLRLLLDGAAPENIVCLTYTRNAAAEMARRLQARLALWAAMPNDALTKALTDALGASPSDVMLRRARGLFAQALEAPGGMKIHTIHAFCESLLKRFPLEAGMAPDFRVLDDTQTEAARHRAMSLALAREEVAKAELANAVGALTADILVRSVFLPALAEREALAQDAQTQALRARLELPEGATEATTLAEIAAVPHADALRAAAGAWGSATPAGAKSAAKIAAFLKLAEDKRQGSVLEDYLKVFLTDKGTMRARLAPKAVSSDDAACLREEATRVEGLRTRLSAVRAARASEAALILARAFLRAYDEEKRQLNGVDYDDLINKTRALFDDPGAQWVLHKLDAGLDHLLLDEAQDMSRPQWEIARKLVEEFYAGQGARSDRIRTFFAVGDPKQSIYSFQRADVLAYDGARSTFADAARAAGQRWDEPRLETSWRSCPQPLALADALCAGAPSDNPYYAFFAHTQHQAERAKEAGSAQVWQPTLGDTAADARAALARGCAAWVREALERGLLVGDGQGGQRPARAGDVMILARRRDETSGHNALFARLIQELDREGVMCAGPDRINLAQDLAASDLLALARAACLPEDDYELACYLKSPLGGLDDDALIALTALRQAQSLPSLFAALDIHSRVDTKAAAALDQLMAARARSQEEDPFAFFAAILANGGRRRLLGEADPDSRAATLDAFLDKVLEWRAASPASLRAFLAWLDANPGAFAFKRDDAVGTDAVRVMTAHAAKGLEAPIVLVVEDRASDEPAAVLRPSLVRHDGVTAWRAPGTDLPFFTQAQEAWRDKQVAEEYRLLYVALTRARDHVVVAGAAWGGAREGAGAARGAAGEKPNWRTRAEAACRAAGGVEDARGLRLGALAYAADAATPRRREQPRAKPPQWARVLAPGDAAPWRETEEDDLAVQTCLAALTQEGSVFADDSQWRQFCAADINVRLVADGTSADTSINTSVGTSAGGVVRLDAVRGLKDEDSPIAVLVLLASSKTAATRRLALGVALLGRRYPRRRIDAFLGTTDMQTLTRIPASTLDAHRQS